jgi:hypothetical protein
VTERAVRSVGILYCVLISLVFWPLWLVLPFVLGAWAMVTIIRVVGHRAHGTITAVMGLPPLARAVIAAVKGRQPFARAANALVDVIARHKATMLGCSLAVLVLLSVTALIDTALGHGAGLTASVIKAGGYVAIVGLVFGLPALGYAMVTDRSAQRIWEAIGVSEPTFAEMETNIRDEIAAVLSDWITRVELPSDHHVQIFAPNLQRNVLRPIYDPTETGPEEGWKVGADAPQAVTGSAWVSNEYLFAIGEALADPALRLRTDQLEQYANLTGVAAAPIRDPETHAPIGVLTIFTEGVPQMATPEFVQLHLALARAVAPVVSAHVAPKGPLDSASHYGYGAISPDDVVGRITGRVESQA